MRSFQMLPLSLLLSALVGGVDLQARPIGAEELPFRVVALPSFIPNHGQFDDPVEFQVRGQDRTLFFTTTGVTTCLRPLAGAAEQWIVKMDFVGADPTVRPVGGNPRPTLLSYFSGDPDLCAAAVPTYGEIIYSDLWPGIDLTYTGTSSGLKYRFVVRPGADPEQIRLAYRGVTGLTIAESGALRVETPISSFEDDRPTAWQTDGEQEIPIHVEYVMNESDEASVPGYGFSLGPHDPELTLVIDPIVHVYCGFLGGSYTDLAFDIALGPEGFVYLVGNTGSGQSTFPVQVGPDVTYNGGVDAFVAKLDPTDATILYCGYIGGANYDSAHAIAVDDQGRAYITGRTVSNQSSFPVTVGPDLTYDGFKENAFVARVSKDGTSLEYCGYIGGDGFETGDDIAVDAQYRAYVVGTTESIYGSFPVTVGPDLKFGGGASDGFIVRIDAGGTGMEFSGYIGGREDDDNAITLDSQGYAYVTGQTGSSAKSFPLAVGPDLSHNGGQDAFVVKVDPTGTSFVLGGYIGGTGNDEGLTIALDHLGSIYIAGATTSTETSFPVLVGPDLTHNGEEDIFVAKIDATTASLVYCGYIGGTASEQAREIAVDSFLQMHLCGRTRSSMGFPASGGPDLSHNGLDDGFIALLDPTGGDLVYCGYIGGDDFDHCRGLAVDPGGIVYTAGYTYSDESTFPTVIGPDLTQNGNYDCFITKLAPPLSPDTYELSVQGSVVKFRLHPGLDHAKRDYLLLASVSGTMPGTPLPGGMATLPLNWDSISTIVLVASGSPLLSDFDGTLDATGSATVVLAPGPLPPLAIGATLTFAYALENPWDFASNPVSLLIVP